MTKNVVAFLAAALIAALPLTAAAQHDHGKSGKKMNHGTHGKAEHGTHGKAEHGKAEHGTHGKADEGHDHGDMIMLGDQSVAGVKGMAHLNDVKEAMAKVKMKETHHFMVLFMDETTGTPIEEGTVAVKIVAPNGKEIGPVRLVAMDGHFGADIILEQAGSYAFQVGSRLPDGQTRQFEFMHILH